MKWAKDGGKSQSSGGLHCPRGVSALLGCTGTSGVAASSPAALPTHGSHEKWLQAGESGPNSQEKGVA